MDNPFLIKESSPAIRSPQQQRSKQRAEQILAAARQIILQKGCANLTISEIAEVAGVTPGSMYQYYRNKSAIVLALGQYYVDLFQQQLGDIFAAPVTSREQLGELFLEVLEQYYQLYREDPVVRDIWAGMATDKAMQDLDQRDTDRHLQFFYEIASPLFSSATASELPRFLKVLLHLGVAGARLALTQSDEEGRYSVDATKKVLSYAWLQFCRSYPK